MTTSKRHQEISETFLKHAEDEFEKGDMLRAIEKAWGAIAHYVKSIARELQWPNETHRDIIGNATVLLNYTADKRHYDRMFWAVRTMHINFYDEKFAIDDVRGRIDDAKTLIDAFKRAEPQFPRKRPDLEKEYGEFKNREKRRSIGKRRKEF